MAVNRDGTNKSQAKSGPARVYSACLESLADFAGGFFVPCRKISLGLQGSKLKQKLNSFFTEKVKSAISKFKPPEGI